MMRQSPNFYYDNLILSASLFNGDIWLPLNRNRGLGPITEGAAEVSRIKPSLEYWQSLEVLHESSSGGGTFLSGLMVVVQRVARIQDCLYWPHVELGFCDGIGGARFKNIWADYGVCLYIPVQGSTSDTTDSRVKSGDVIHVSGVYYAYD